MKRSLSWIGAGLIGLAPLSALALFMSPSDVLLAIQFDGSPRTFSMEAHGHMDDEDVHGSAWISGSMEGKTANDAKVDLSATVDIIAEGENVRVKGHIRVVDAVAYVKIDTVELSDPSLMAEMPSFPTPWLSIPLLPMEDMPMSDDPFEVFAMQLDMLDIQATPEELREWTKALLDAIFTMDTMPSGNGHTYSIKLSPRMLQKALPIIAQAMEHFTGEDMTEDMPSLRDPEILEMQEMIRKAVNLHIKVDTNASDAYRSMKYYVSVDVPDEDVFVVVQGSEQKSASLSIIAPSDAEDFETWIEAQTDTEVHDWPLFPGEDAWEEDATWEEDFDSNSWEEDIWTPSGCMDGSVNQVAMQRKGLCPMERHRTRSRD